MNRLILLFVLLSLFIASPLLNAIGYPHAKEFAAGYFKVLPTTYLAVLFLIIFVHRSKNVMFATFVNYKHHFYYLTFLSCLLLFLIFVKNANSIAFIFDTFFTTICFSIIYPKSNFSLNKIVLTILLSFYLVNCLLASVEKGFNFNLLEPVIGVGDNGLRATSLHGHPLNNALVTVIIMSFIYLSEIKHKNKFLLIGIISLISFGARGALYGFGGLTFVFLLNKVIFNLNTTSESYLKYKNRKSNVSQIILMLSCLITSYYLITDTRYGERLNSVSYFDEGSAGVRISVLKIFDYYSFSDLIWGLSAAKVDNLKYLLDLPVIENFWIQWLLTFGLIFTLIFSIFLIRMLFKQLRFYKNNEKIYLVSTFLVVASTNNSLATSTAALIVFVICSFVFPSTINSKDLVSKSHKFSINK